LKKHGVRFKDYEADIYLDSRLNHPACVQSFGKGNCNTVEKLVYGANAYVFKPETGARIDRLYDRNLVESARPPLNGNRNIGSRAVSELLGLDVIPKARFTTHNGDLGLLMDMAPGRPVARQRADRLAWIPQPPWPESEQPSSDLLASVHDKLNGLEWCDMMTGQTDRHQENYLLEITGSTARVTGIDNDLAFSSREAGLVQPDAHSNNAVGTPKLIDGTLYDRITEMNIDDALRRLEGLFSEEEIAASRQRFAAVQTAARALNDTFVVRDWKAWRSPAGETASQFLAAQKQGSLFGRDFALFCPEACAPPAPPNAGPAPSAAAAAVNPAEQPSPAVKPAAADKPTSTERPNLAAQPHPTAKKEA